jgi:hypothetical protein
MSPGPGHRHPGARIPIITRIITRDDFKIKFPGLRKEQEEELTGHHHYGKNSVSFDMRGR